eukprot:Gb_16779 [translate_table: standard]
MESKVAGAEGGGKSRGIVDEANVAVDVDVDGNGGKGDGDVEKGGDGTERECRVCHMVLEKNQDIELGCACKDDLAFAHKHCAETWFKIKGDRTCEICGSTARNVVNIEDAEVMDQWNEGNTTAPTITEERNSWCGHHFLNFLLACVVFAFVISWLFRFSIPS